MLVRSIAIAACVILAVDGVVLALGNKVPATPTVLGDDRPSAAEHAPDVSIMSDSPASDLLSQADRRSSQRPDPSEPTHQSPSPPSSSAMQGQRSQASSPTAGGNDDEGELPSTDGNIWGKTLTDPNDPDDVPSGHTNTGWTLGAYREDTPDTLPITIDVEHTPHWPRRGELVTFTVTFSHPDSVGVDDNEVEHHLQASINFGDTKSTHFGDANATRPWSCSYPSSTTTRCITKHAFRAGGSFRVYGHASCYCPHLEHAQARKGHQVEVEGRWDAATNGAVEPLVTLNDQYGLSNGFTREWIVEAIDDDAMRARVTIDWGDGTSESWTSSSADPHPLLHYPRIYISERHAHTYSSYGEYRVTSTIETMTAGGDRLQATQVTGTLHISPPPKPPPPPPKRVPDLDLPEQVVVGDEQGAFIWVPDQGEYTAIPHGVVSWGDGATMDLSDNERWIRFGPGWNPQGVAHTWAEPGTYVVTYSCPTCETVTAEVLVQPAAE